MASVPVVTNDLAVQIGSRKVPLTPSQAFGLAEKLIRAGTRAMIVEEADRAAVLDTVREGAGRDVYRRLTVASCQRAHECVGRHFRLGLSLALGRAYFALVDRRANIVCLLQ